MEKVLAIVHLAIAHGFPGGRCGRFRVGAARQLLATSSLSANEPHVPVLVHYYISSARSSQTYADVCWMAL